MKMKNKGINIDIDKANELFLYGKEIMDLPPGHLLTCASFIIAMVMKMHIPQHLWKAQMAIIHEYIEEELIPVLDTSKAAPFKYED